MLYHLTEPIVFWTRYLSALAWHKVTGRHQWRTFNVTNGDVYVICIRCAAEREPTPMELRANRWYGVPPDVRARQRAREEELNKILKEQGYI